VVLAGPRTMMPTGVAAVGVPDVYPLEEARVDADVVMLLRVQLERMGKPLFPTVKEYFQLFALTQERLKLAKDDASVMHPGPMNRGIEIASDVADGDRSVILEQVSNGVSVRMAVLYLCSGMHAEAA
jgi:aspartate carbamoyltransferase catalytic subunit